jgi:pimeloyl-ACP methyl ester carboxylesterase
MWEKVVPKLTGRYDVLVPHLAGFGDGPIPGRKLSAEDHASLLKHAMEERRITGATVAGISYGGMVAATLAALAPDLVTSLVLVCPTGTINYPWITRIPFLARFTGLMVRKIIPGHPALAERLSRRQFHDITARPPDLVKRFLSQLSLTGHTEALLSAIAEVLARGACLPALVRTLGQPVCLAWGANDKTIPARHAKSVTAARPDVRLTVLPGCAHSLPLERPDDLSRLIGEADDGTGQPAEPVAGNENDQAGLTG